MATRIKKKNPDNKGQFVKGNKAAEKWTVETVLQKLDEMWQVVATDDEGGKPRNPIRANDIKTLAEVCLMCGVGRDTWAYFSDKFKDEPAVLRIIKNIEWVLEQRVIYSGQTMDIFVLKNKYGFSDRQELDHTTKGKEIAPQSLVFVAADSLTDEQINKILNDGQDSGIE